MQKSDCVYFKCFRPNKTQSPCLIAKGSYKFIKANCTERVAQVKRTEPAHVISNPWPLMEQREEIAAWLHPIHEKMLHNFVPRRPVIRFHWDWCFLPPQYGVSAALCLLPGSCMKEAGFNSSDLEDGMRQYLVAADPWAKTLSDRTLISLWGTWGVIRNLSMGKDWWGK